MKGIEMPFWTGLGCILLPLAIVATVAWLVFRRKEKRLQHAEKESTEQGAAKGRRGDDNYSSSRRDNDDTTPLQEANYKTQGSLWVSIGLWLAVALIVVLESTVMVDTKNVAVVTSFGRPTDALDNGFHIVEPWKKVSELNAAIQTDSHAGVKDGNDPNPNNDTALCTNVRIAHQVTGCVDNSIRWRIKQDAADGLYRDYRTENAIRDSLVTRQLQAILNTVFMNYDPLALDKNGNSTASSMSDLQVIATKMMRDNVGANIEVDGVILQIVHYQTEMQTKLNNLQGEVGATRVAQQHEQTSNAEAEANKKLADSISHDPNVLVSKCLDIVRDGKVALPAGFSCWPGGGSSVVLPATK